jgi:DNA-directed RNA polymerase specialized sigma24 family protein
MEVITRQVKQITRVGEYAKGDDFCRIFDANMNRLYLLAFLLTGDHAQAEQCFVSALEDAIEGNPVFREWAHSWSGRAIIQNAVTVVEPRPDDARGSLRSNSGDCDYEGRSAGSQIELSAVLGLEVFERIVYVMTVLERYSDHECSLLLGCARRDVLPARTRALEKIGCQVEMHDRQLPIAG